MKLKLKLQNKGSELLSATSIHGPSKILSAKNLLHKLFWLILVLGSVVYCSSVIVNYVLEYLDYPVVTNTDILNVDQPEFPAIRICYHDKSALQKETIYFNDKRIKYEDWFREVNDDCSEFNGGN